MNKTWNKKWNQTSNLVTYNKQEMCAKLRGKGEEGEILIKH